jgi:phosphoenolpyruvate carboxylase
VLALTGERALAERFPAFRRRIEAGRPLVDRCNRWQADLLARYRAAPEDGEARRQVRVPLLLSMNCVAAGLGWTG